MTLFALSGAVWVGLVGLGGSVLAYLGAIRHLSGKVKTSEASDLWEESREIRRDYARRIEELNTVVARCQGRLDEMESTNDALRSDNGKLGRLVDEHERTIKELRTQVDVLTTKNESLEAKNATLLGRIRELEANAK